MNIKDLPKGSYKVIQPSGLLNAAAVGARPVTPVTHQSIESLKAAQADAEKNAKSVNSFFWKPSNLIHGALQVGVGDPTRLFTSLGEGINQVFKTGGATSASGKTYKVPGLDPFQSFQSEADRKAKEGVSPVNNILSTGAKTVMAGVDTIGTLSLADQALTKLGTIRRDSKIWKLIQPKLAGKDLQTANKLGELKKSKFLRTVKPVQDQELIDVARPYLKTSDPIKGAQQISNGVEQEANKLIEGVGNRGGTWSVNNLTGAISKTKVPLGVKGVSDAQVEGVKAYVKTLGKGAPKNAGGALKVAKQFRATINDEFGENIWYKDTPIAKYVRSINRSLNDFAGSLLPEGKLSDGTLFSDSLRKQSKLFEILDNIVAKTPKVGTNILSKSKEAIKGALKVGGVIEGYRLLTGKKP